MSVDENRELFDLMDSINKDAESDKKKKTKIVTLKDAIDYKFDDYDSFNNYKEFMLEEVRSEITFKRHARIWSLSILGGLSLFMFVNVFIMIYGGGRSFWKISIPTFDSKIILAMITATFANLFAIITLVFKYIFSPTSDLMTHAKDMNGKE